MPAASLAVSAAAGPQLLIAASMDASSLPPPYIPVAFALAVLVGVSVLQASLGDVYAEEADLGISSGINARKVRQREWSGGSLVPLARRVSADRGLKQERGKFILFQIAVVAGGGSGCLRRSTREASVHASWLVIARTCATYLSFWTSAWNATFRCAGNGAQVEVLL